MLQALERANRLFLQQNNYNADNYSALYAKKGFLKRISKKHQFPAVFTDGRVLILTLRVFKIWSLVCSLFLSLINARA